MENKRFALVATKYKGKKMIAPMYFLETKERMKELRKKGYSDIKLDLFK